MLIRTSHLPLELLQWIETPSKTNTELIIAPIGLIYDSTTPIWSQNAQRISIYHSTSDRETFALPDGLSTG